MTTDRPASPGADWSGDWSTLTREIVFDRVWSRPGLTTRERRLVTIALLAASGADSAGAFHLRAGLKDGIPADDLYELIVHTAVYAGWATGGRGIAWLRAVVEDVAREDVAREDEETDRAAGTEEAAR